jgi:hypothetical protein
MRVLDDHASHVIVEGVVEGDLCEALSLHPRAESLCVRNSWVRLGGDGTRSYPAVRTLVIRNVWMDEPLDVSRLVALLPNLQILVLCDVCDVVMTHHLARLRSLEWLVMRRCACAETLDLRAVPCHALSVDHRGGDVWLPTDVAVVRAPMHVLRDVTPRCIIITEPSTVPLDDDDDCGEVFEKCEMLACTLESFPDAVGVVDGPDMALVIEVDTDGTAEELDRVRSAVAGGRIRRVVFTCSRNSAVAARCANDLRGRLYPATGTLITYVTTGDPRLFIRCVCNTLPACLWNVF